MSFDEWLDEMELFADRRTRFADDAGENYELMLKWLKAAYEVGRSSAK